MKRGHSVYIYTHTCAGGEMRNEQTDRIMDEPWGRVDREMNGQAVVKDSRASFSRLQRRCFFDDRLFSFLERRIDIEGII